MNGKSRPVVIIFSILAGLQILSNAGGLSEVMGAKIFFLFGIIVAATQVGMTFYVQNTVTPNEDVAAYANSHGQVVAGPAAGVTNGKTVEVVKTELPPSEGEGVPPAPRDQMGYIRGNSVILGVAIIAVVVILILVFNR